TTLLVHGSIRPFEMDQNGDSFLDFPTGKQINFVNRWVYNSGNGWLGQLSVKYLKDEKQGGQTGFTSEDKFTTNRYGLEINTERSEFVGKLGYQFADKPYKSFGFQLNGVNHVQDSYFGFNRYDAKEQSVYANLIYQSIIGSTFHKFKTGMSFLLDDYHETLGQATLPGGISFDRFERVPGAFFEYSYDDTKKFSLIAGVRVDQHNLFGTLFVPRLHAKYDLTPTTTIRASMGRGIRLANIIAENTGFLASSRSLMFQYRQSANAYGFVPDKAWNYGLNFLQEFTIDYRPGSISVDYFFTDFQNQVVMDLDNNPRQVTFFALQGKSFSHSIQVQVDYQLARRFDLRLAYRWLDVETDYLNGRLQRPLIPKDRAFANLSYKTKNNWVFDYTLQRVGKQRIPNTTANPSEYQLASFSDPYVMMNAQVTKDLGAKWSVYLGVENMTDFKLSNPIVAANDPFGPYFDSSMVWGPVFGRMYYAGFRYRVK
ncbi:MAG TPA: TonB-dependent receptor, partial [Cyclobacteriaceae bacterium]|nr:TonB-dependent receptor [Cyclobacteriaceae bacterium]